MLRTDTVLTNNLATLESAYERLSESAIGVPKFGLVKGVAGFGKTTGLIWLSTRCNGIYVTASPLWTPREMLKTILDDIGIPVVGSNQQMAHSIVNHLAMNNRPLFIDDIDFIFDCTNNPQKIIETFRYIHDQAGVPVLLVGMDQIDRKIARREQLSSRIKEIIEFDKMNEADARQVADRLMPEIHCTDDLLHDLLTKAHGGIRRFTIGLDQIKRVAGYRSLTRMDLAEWQRAEMPYFLER